MSRSYKKNPYCKYGGMPEGKKFANKRVRRSSVISNHSWYKRLYCQYNIYDVISYYTLRDWFNMEKRIYSLCGKEKDINEIIYEYKKWYIIK